MIAIAITCRDRGEARTIAKHLLEKKLIACANMFPVESLYFWEDEMKDDREVMLLCKSMQEHYEQIRLEVEGMHSYDTPLIEAWHIDHINEGYANWLEGEVTRE